MCPPVYSRPTLLLITKQNHVAISYQVNHDLDLNFDLDLDLYLKFELNFHLMLVDELPQFVELFETKIVSGRSTLNIIMSVDPPTVLLLFISQDIENKRLFSTIILG